MSEAHKQLLRYLVNYRRLRESMSGRRLLQQLVLAYAKQVATGMPEKQWQENIIILINECERENVEERNRQSAKLKKLQEKAEQLRKI